MKRVRKEKWKGDSEKEVGDKGKENGRVYVMTDISSLGKHESI
jgi:hypothetical protein